MGGLKVKYEEKHNMQTLKGSYINYKVDFKISSGINS